MTIFSSTLFLSPACLLLFYRLLDKFIQKKRIWCWRSWYVLQTSREPRTEVSNESVNTNFEQIFKPKVDTWYRSFCWPWHLFEIQKQLNAILFVEWKALKKCGCSNCSTQLKNFIWGGDKYELKIIIKYEQRLLLAKHVVQDQLEAIIIKQLV